MKVKKILLFILCSVVILQSKSLYPIKNNVKSKNNNYLLKTIKTSYPTNAIHTLDIGNKNTFVCTIADKVTLLDLQNPNIEEKNQYTLDATKTNITIFSPQGDKLAIKDRKNIKIIHLPDKKTYEKNKSILDQLESASSFAWHPDNEHFAIIKLFMLKIFKSSIENNTSKELKTYYIENYLYINTISFSPDGNYISFVANKYSGETAVGFVNLKTGKILEKEFIFADKLTDEKLVTFIPKKNWLIISKNQEKKCTLDILSIKNDNIKIIKKINLTEPTKCIDCLPSGKFVAIATKKTIKIIDLKTGKIKHTLEGHTEKITNLKCSKSGKYIISTGKDFTIRIWKNPLANAKKTRLAFLQEKENIFGTAKLWKNAE